MKKRKKKGFTIVELVIVIAVIAILAAVLIPTFSGIVKKANLSSDVQNVRNMNLTLFTESVIVKPSDVLKAKEYLLTGDFTAKSLTPKTNGCHYYWYEPNNTIYLVEDEDDDQFDVYYPEDQEKANVTKANSYRLDAVYYSVTTAFTHCTPNKVISIIEEGKDIEYVITPDETFYTPVVENITVTGGDKKWNGTTKTLTIENITGNITISVTALNNKAEQVAPVSPTMDGKTATSITLDTITTKGHGQVEYAKNTTESAPTEGWQTSVDFTGLTNGTTYYFFSRYAGDDNYNSSPASIASEAITTLHTYTIDVAGVTNATGASENPTSIVEGALDVSLTFTANTNYKLPDDVTVSGATKTSWTKNTGVLVISNPTTNVSITITAELDAFTVTFDKQSGTGGSDSVSATYGQAMPSITPPTRTGYTFNGYYDNTNGTGTQYYDKDGQSNANYSLTTGTTLYASWTSAWKSLRVKNVNYYPVLGGTKSEPEVFAYSTDGTNFTKITATGAENTYQMSDVASYAKAGTLYYSGGAVFAVRSVQCSWKVTFKDNSGGTYPYWASTNSDYLQDGIKGQIDISKENVEKVAIDEEGEPNQAPKIYGVELASIYNAYKDGTSQGFGGSNGEFLSSVKNSQGNAACGYNCSGSQWNYNMSCEENFYVLISRKFN